MNTKRFKGSKAFTLIELLVATGVTALLVTLMLAIVTNVMGGWSRSSGTLSAGNQGRAILDYLARDLNSLVVQRNSQVWLVASVQPNQTSTGDAGMSSASWSAAKPNVVQLAPTPNDIQNYRFGQAGVWLRFFTATTTSETESPNVRAVSYQMIRQKVGDGGNAATGQYRYQLYRSVVSAENTFASGYNITAAAYTTGDGTAGAAGSVRRPNTQFVLANNVIDFGVRFFTNTSGNLTQVFPASATNLGYAISNALPTPSPASGATFGYPVVAEIFIRILTDEGVSQIEALERGTTTGDWWEIAAANSIVYTRRVDIKSQGL